MAALKNAYINGDVIIDVLEDLDTTAAALSATTAGMLAHGDVEGGVHVARVLAQGNVEQGVGDTGMLAPIEEEVHDSVARLASATASGVLAPGDAIAAGVTGIVAAQGNVKEEVRCTGDGAVALKVAALGALADLTATAAALYKCAHGGAGNGDELAYLLGIGSVFAAGVAEMLAALWVSGDPRARGATGRKILYASLVTLLLGIVLDGFAYKLKK